MLTLAFTAKLNFLFASLFNHVKETFFVSCCSEISWNKRILFIFIYLFILRNIWTPFKTMLSFTKLTPVKTMFRFTKVVLRLNACGHAAEVYCMLAYTPYLPSPLQSAELAKPNSSYSLFFDNLFSLGIQPSNVTKFLYCVHQRNEISISWSCASKYTNEYRRRRSIFVLCRHCKI